MEQLFLTVNSWMSQGLLLGAMGCFLWGMVSVLFSPCHLASIPLIIGYVGGQNHLIEGRKATLYAVVFTTGLFITIAAIGLICSLLGRMLGDVGPYLDHCRRPAADLGCPRYARGGALLPAERVDGQADSEGALRCFHTWPRLWSFVRFLHLRFYRANPRHHFGSGQIVHRRGVHFALCHRPLHPYSYCRKFDCYG
jgi:hypothetical protein